MLAAAVACVVVFTLARLLPARPTAQRRRDAMQRRIGWGYGYGAGFTDATSGRKHDNAPPPDGRTR
jgi:hypothetical protein